MNATHEQVPSRISLDEIRSVLNTASQTGNIDFVVLYEEFVEKRGLTLDEYQDVVYLIRSNQV